MDNKNMKLWGGGRGKYQLNNIFNYPSIDLQLFADGSLSYNKVDNPYEFYLTKPTYAKGRLKSNITYDLEFYYSKIPNYDTITVLPKENADYIKEALPNVTSCFYMTGTIDNSCEELTSINTTGWDTSNITNMSGMFYGCYKLKELDVSNLDTSNATSMAGMFSMCGSLKTLDVSKWDTSKVTSMYDIFNGCGVTKLDLSNWDTSNVVNMNRMFSTSGITTILGVIDMKSCTSYDGMFESCINLTGVKIKNPPAGITATSGIGGLAAGRYEIVS